MCVEPPTRLLYWLLYVVWCINDVFYVIRWQRIARRTKTKQTEYGEMTESMCVCWWAHLWMCLTECRAVFVSGGDFCGPKRNKPLPKQGQTISPKSSSPNLITVFSVSQWFLSSLHAATVMVSSCSLCGSVRWRCHRCSSPNSQAPPLPWLQ